MSLANYIESRYTDACSLQRSIDRDTKMVAMLRKRGRDQELVKAWMRDYGLFRGIATADRIAIVRAFLNFAVRHRRKPEPLSSDDVRGAYDALFRELYGAVNRSWMSASSKLLWCMYPKSVAIYDSFVHRTLLVLQCVDPDLQGSQKIGRAPEIESAADISASVDHYMAYEISFRRLLKVHTPRLRALRKRHQEDYEFDVRILDKLLWMIGNPREEWQGRA